MFSLCVLLVAPHFFSLFPFFFGKLRLEIVVIICSLLNMKISFWSTICVPVTPPKDTRKNGETNLLTCAKLVAYSRLDIAI